MNLEKYSMGVGDRFGRQGKAQLRAFIEAKKAGIDVVPVWNKSNREHTLIGTKPADVRKEADAAAAALRWPGSYYVDADHVNAGNIDGFIESSDFFTLDVADYIGKPAGADAKKAFMERFRKYVGKKQFDGGVSVEVSEQDLAHSANTFLYAIEQAGELYRRVAAKKGAGRFVTEVSMDEVDRPQTPAQMLLILGMIGAQGVPAQTIAPRFAGAFYKGVDYVGSVEEFDRQFYQHLSVIRFAVKEFGLPANLKLSIHSGSDKFSLYAPIRRAMETFDAGLHMKTAGTTWLEEVIGLCEAGGEAVELVKELYRRAWERKDELAAAYAAVIHVTNPPRPEAISAMSGPELAAAVRHDRSNPRYNPELRQLFHIAYKIAAEMGDDYYNMLDAHEEIIAAHVTGNIYERHLKPVFGG
jgi:hypothetical protein